MNRNLLTGLVIGAIVIIGGAFLIYGAGKSTEVDTAVTTPDETTHTNTGTVPVGGTGTTVTPSTTVNPTPTSPLVTPSTVVAVSNSSAVVTGKITPNGSPTVYWYEYDTTNAFGLRTANQSLGAGYASVAAPALISGVSPNTKYFYRLKAMNAYGTITGQSLSFTTNTTVATPGVLPVVGSDTATLITNTSATLNAHLTPNSPPVSYWFEYGLTVDMGSTTAIKSTNSTVKVGVSAVLTGLKPFTKYYFRLNAQNAYGTLNSQVTTFTTK
jgi:phosphodiesterase/alkaline phosphatase D-like protein